MGTPSLFIVGVTHRSAPFGFRERLALGPELEAALAAALAGLRSLREFAVLGTCNRIEIYGVGDSGAHRHVAAALGSLRGLFPEDIDRHGIALHGGDAVDHLLQVASGLDSQILGENEIFGQVKRAYAVARERGSAGPVLNRLFQKAFQAAKHVRTHTRIASGQVSVANVAVDLAQMVFGSLGNASLLLLGAGEMGGKSARAFQSRGIQRTCVTSRHPGRAEALARDLGAATAPFEERTAGLSDADIVVCSTSAPGTILSAADVARAMAGRPSRPMLLIDLAMPRDVDAAAARIDNVFLYNLDDLAGVAARNRQARLVEAEAGRLALAPRAESLWAALQIQMATLPVSPGAAMPAPAPQGAC